MLNDYGHLLVTDPSNAVADGNICMAVFLGCIVPVRKQKKNYCTSLVALKFIAKHLINDP